MAESLEVDIVNVTNSSAVIPISERKPAVPFITGATSFTGCFLVAELLKKPISLVPKIILFVRAKDPVQAEARVRETIAKWWPPVAPGLDFSRCSFVCGTDLIQAVKDVFKASAAATDANSKITDVFDFAMKVNYSTRYKVCSSLPFFSLLIHSGFNPFWIAHHRTSALSGLQWSSCFALSASRRE